MLSRMAFQYWQKYLIVNAKHMWKVFINTWANFFYVFNHANTLSKLWNAHNMVKLYNIYGQTVQQIYVINYGQIWFQNHYEVQMHMAIWPYTLHPMKLI